MAKKINHDGKLEVVHLTRKEAADVVALLAGLLAGKHIQGHQSGEAPVLHVVKDGQIDYCLGFIVDDSP